MASKFRYRLQKVLDLRAKNEDNLKLEMVAQQALERKERDALDEIKLREQLGQKNMDGQLAAGRTADVQMSNDYLSSLKEKIAAQEKKWQAAAEQLKAAEAKYRKAQRDTEVVRKHKEKSYERWLAEEKRLEAIRLDEMSANMFQAKQRRQKADDEEQAEYDEARERERAEAQAGEEAIEVAESMWIQGFMETAYDEARRLSALRERLE